METYAFMPSKEGEAQALADAQQRAGLERELARVFDKIRTPVERILQAGSGQMLNHGRAGGGMQGDASYPVMMVRAPAAAQSSLEEVARHAGKGRVRVAKLPGYKAA